DLDAALERDRNLVRSSLEVDVHTGCAPALADHLILDDDLSVTHLHAAERDGWAARDEPADENVSARTPTTLTHSPVHTSRPPPAGAEGRRRGAGRAARGGGEDTLDEPPPVDVHRDDGQARDRFTRRAQQVNVAGA